MLPKFIEWLVTAPRVFNFGPRMIITNGMVVPNYSSREDYDRMFALGVSM